MRLLIALLLLPALLSEPDPSVEPGPAPRALQDRHKEFLDKFNQALAIKAHDEMAHLINVYEQEAIGRIVLTCEQIAERPSEETENLMWALRKAWKTGKNTGFPDQMYEYYSLLDPTLKRERTKQKNDYYKALARYESARAAKDGPQLELAALEFQGLAKSFGELGDRFWESQCWFVIGEAYDEDLRGNDANQKKAAEAYGKGLELRKAMELDDRFARQNKQRYDYLVAQGWIDGGVVSGGTPPEGGPPPEGGAPSDPGSAAPPPGTTASATGAAITASLSFALLADLEAIKRPLFTADDLYPVWSSLNLAKNGSKARFQNLIDGPDVVRHGAADVRVDKNRDGNPSEDEKVPLTGKMTPVQVEVGKGEETRPWAFLMITGLEKDTYQGIETNLQPGDDYMALYMLSAASMVGEISGTAVRVIDDNMDGVYGSPPLAYQFAGVSADHFQPEMDSIVVGSEKRAQPWSEYTNIAGQWWQLESKKGGKELVATPVTVRTGTLKLDCKGANKPVWLVVRGSSRFENSYFDLAGAGSQGVEVPVGKYELYYGEIRKGKKRQMSKAVILPGTATPKWDVLEGQSATLELGEPYSFEFRAEREGNKMVVLGNSVVVTGRGHERYERVWNSVPRPEVSWRKGGAKRGSKPEDMDIILGQDDLNNKGLLSAWFPLDTEFELRGVSANDKVEVQLTQKKNPLFGKIESDWK